MFILTVGINSWNNGIAFVLSGTTGHEAEEEREHWLIKGTQICFQFVLFQKVSSGDYFKVDIEKFCEEDHHGKP